jgi:hypothetical protein
MPSYWEPWEPLEPSPFLIPSIRACLGAQGISLVIGVPGMCKLPPNNTSSGITLSYRGDTIRHAGMRAEVWGIHCALTTVKGAS